MGVLLGQKWYTNIPFLNKKIKSIIYRVAVRLQASEKTTHKTIQMKPWCTVVEQDIATVHKMAQFLKPTGHKVIERISEEKYSETKQFIWERLGYNR